MSKMELSKWNIFFLFMWGILLTFFVHVYLSYAQPSKLRPLVEKQITQYVPGQTSIEKIRLKVFPRLGIEFENVAYTNSVDNLHVHVYANTLNASIAWLPLFKGKLELDSIHLINSDIQVTRQETKDVNEDKKEQELAEEKQAKNVFFDYLSLENRQKLIPKILVNTHFKISDSSVLYTVLTEKNTTKERYQLYGLNSQIQSFEQIEFAFSDFKHLSAEQPDKVVNLSHFKFTLNGVDFAHDVLTSQVTLSSRLALLNGHWQNYFKSSGIIKLSSDLKLLPSTQKISLVSDLNVEEVRYTAEANIDAHIIDNNTIDIPVGSLLLGNDEVVFKGKVLNPFSDFLAQLQVDAKRVSLTEYLSFARNLPPALARALNNITGTFDTQINSTGFEASNLVASIGGVELKGEARIENWRKPKLEIDVKAQEVDANIFLPEVLGKNAPVLKIDSLPFDTLFAQYSTSKKSSNFSYDVDIYANKAKFWKYAFNNVSLSVEPHKRGVQMPINIASFAGGSAHTFLIFEKNGINISGTIKSIPIQSLLKPLVAKSPVEGVLNAEFNQFGAGKTFLEMAARFSGTLKASLKNPVFITEKDKIQFDLLSLNTKTRGLGINLSKPYLHSLDGTYTLKLEKNAESISLHLPQAKIPFNLRTGLPESLSPTSANIDINLKKPVKMTTKSYGMLSFNIPQEKVSYHSFEGAMPVANISGDIDFSSFTSPQVQGSIKAKSSNFAEFLRSLGINTPNFKDIHALSNFELTLPFSYQNSQFLSSNISAQIDKTSIRAYYQDDFSYVGQGLLNIEADYLNVDSYTTLSTTNAPPLSSREKLPLDFLTSLNLKGDLFIKKLWLFDTPFYDFQAPFNFNKGSVRVVSEASIAQPDPAFGKLTADLSLQASKERMLLDTKMSAKGVNMLQLTQARGQESLIGGDGYFDVSLSSVVESYADIFSTLGGNFSLWVENGYMAPALPRGNTSKQSPPSPSNLDLEKKRTHFSALSASGNIQRGIVETHNINLTGSQISFSGNARVDLPRWYVNLDGRAVYNGISAIPIQVEGSIADPTLKIRLINAIASAISSFTGKIVNSIADILKSSINLLPL